MGNFKRTVCVDLDGVLAMYDHWRGTNHIGTPLPGAVEFTQMLSHIASVVIYTTRCKLDASGRKPEDTLESLQALVKAWLDTHNFYYDEIYIGQGKPLASVYIDDRNVTICKNPTRVDLIYALARIDELLQRV